MRYAINYFDGIETKILFEKVDEFHFYWSYENLVEFATAHPQKTIVYHPEYSSDLPEWLYNSLPENVIVAFRLKQFTVWDCEIFNKDGKKFYIDEAITSFENATRAKELGVCRLNIAGALFFQMDKVKAYGLPIMVDPRISFSIDAFPGILDAPSAHWIRPEDVEMYEDYIDTICFKEFDEDRVSAFIRIYKEEKKWAGPLNMLIPYVDESVYNRMLNSELTARRLNCGQVCRTPVGTCRLCHRQFSLANPDLFLDKK